MGLHLFPSASPCLNECIMQLIHGCWSGVTAAPCGRLKQTSMVKCALFVVVQVMEHLMV